MQEYPTLITLQSQYNHITNWKSENNTQMISYDREVTKQRLRQNMRVYEGPFDIISRIGIQVKIMDSDLNSEKDLVPRLISFKIPCKLRI